MLFGVFRSPRVLVEGGQEHNLVVLPGKRRLSSEPCLLWMEDLVLVNVLDSSVGKCER